MSRYRMMWKNQQSNGAEPAASVTAKKRKRNAHFPSGWAKRLLDSHWRPLHESVRSVTALVAFWDCHSRYIIYFHDAFSWCWWLWMPRFLKKYIHAYWNIYSACLQVYICFLYAWTKDNYFEKREIFFFFVHLMKMYIFFLFLWLPFYRSSVFITTLHNLQEQSKVSSYACKTVAVKPFTETSFWIACFSFTRAIVL